MAKIVFSTKEWSLELGDGVQQALINETIITSISCDPVAQTKQLKGSDGKLKKEYIYDRQVKYSLSVMFEFKDAADPADCKEFISQCAQGVPYVLSFSGLVPVSPQQYTGFTTAIYPDPDSKVDFSNEDFVQVSLNFTVLESGESIYAERDQLI